MKAVLLVTLLSVFSFSNIQAIFMPQGVGVEWAQDRSSLTLQSNVSETIHYQFVNSSDEIVVSSSLEGFSEETINTTHLATGNYTIYCSYLSGNDTFQVFIDNE